MPPTNSFPTTATSPASRRPAKGSDPAGARLTVAGLSDQDGTAAHHGGDVRVPHGPSATLCNDCQLWRPALSGSFPMAWMGAA
jgi:hypothetical protein